MKWFGIQHWKVVLVLMENWMIYEQSNLIQIRSKWNLNSLLLHVAKQYSAITKYVVCTDNLLDIIIGQDSKCICLLKVVSYPLSFNMASVRVS